jgi:hypothetical protein
LDIVAERCSQKLGSFYDDERIAVSSFACAFKAYCMQDAHGYELLNGAEAHVGSRYGELTRVVVISLDMGQLPNPSTRELAGRRELVERLAVDLNPHMSGTCEVLRTLLGQDIGDGSPWPFFAMINSAKCSSARGMDKVPDEIYRRCLPFAKRELELLQPDVVVTQGQRARKVAEPLEPALLDQVSAAISHLGVSAGSPLAAPLAEMVGRHLFTTKVLEQAVLALVAPHPSDRGGRWQQFHRLGLPLCGAVLRELLGLGPRGMASHPSSNRPMPPAGPAGG